METCANNFLDETSNIGNTNIIWAFLDAPPPLRSTPHVIYGHLRISIPTTKGIMSSQSSLVQKPLKAT